MDCGGRIMKQTLELGLYPDSVPDWGLQQGARELIQNWGDNDKDKAWYYQDETLTLTNHDTAVDRSMFLSGFSGKRDDNSKVGRHGDGTGSALVALLREGKQVLYTNGNTTWKPFVGFSEVFKVDTICLEENVDDNTNVSSFNVDISGISQEEFDLIVDNYLDFQDNIGEVETTTYGDILLDEKHKGRIYVAGLYVTTERELDNGYNFKPEHLKLDRDRKQVDSFDIKWVTKEMWAQVGKTDEGAGFVAEMIANESSDTEFVKHVPFLDKVEDACFEVYKEKYDGKILAESAEEVDKLKASGYHNVTFLGNSTLTSMVKCSDGYKSLNLNVKSVTPVELLEGYKDKWYDDLSTDMLYDYEDMVTKIEKLI